MVLLCLVMPLFRAHELGNPEIGEGIATEATIPVVNPGETK